MAETLGLATFALLAVKAIFGFLGWYSQDGHDKLYRRGLDRAWDVLYTTSFLEITHLGLNRLVSTRPEACKGLRKKG